MRQVTSIAERWQDVLRACQSRPVKPVSLARRAKPGSSRNGRHYRSGIFPKTHLTSREVQCVRAVLHGQSDRETAHKLGISVRTVETHINNVKKKLGLRATSRKRFFISVTEMQLLCNF